MPDATDILLEERILTEAVEKTGRAYQESASVANLREWNAAKAALDKFARSRDESAAGVQFKNLAEVFRWLTRQGYKVTDHTVRNHHKAGYFRDQPGGGFRQEDIEKYAAAKLDRPGHQEQGAPGGIKDRLTLAMAEERELRNQKLRGELIDAAEEEARDARLWGAVRADIENRAPNVINELVERVIGCGLDEEQRQRVNALVPDLRVIYEEFIDEMFDRYAQQGGLEVET